METQAQNRTEMHLQAGFYQPAITHRGETVRLYLTASYHQNIEATALFTVNLINIQQYVTEKYGNPCDFRSVTKDQFRKEVSTLIEGDGLLHFGVLDFDNEVWGRFKIV